MFKKDIDPNIETVSLTDTMFPELENMLSFHDMYLSKDVFVKQAYVGPNGIFVIMPLADDEFGEKERKRVNKSIKVFYDTLGLSLYTYFIFCGDETLYFVYDISNPVKIESELELFIEKLYAYTSEHRTTPLEVTGCISTIEDYEFTGELTQNVLDENTIERIFNTLNSFEGNERPNEKVRIDEDGTEYILRDSDLKVGRFNTGLIGKKDWFRVSEINTNKLALSAVFGGTIGLHKFLTGEVGQGLLYVLTSGFGGILPALDVLIMYCGNYTYNEVAYYQEGNEIIRKKEKVYLRKGTGIFKGLLLTAVAFVIGQVLTQSVYSEILDVVINFIADVGVGIAEKQYS